jgi:hypothetical protein
MLLMKGAEKKIRDSFPLGECLGPESEDCLVKGTLFQFSELI